MPGATETSHSELSPVTVIIRRRVKNGKEAAYESWLEKLATHARQQPGYLGSSIQKPPTASQEYVTVLRFDTVENLDAFEQSERHRAALADVAPLVEADASFEKLTGWEVWFTAPAGAYVPQPSRFRMALLLIVVVFLLVLVIGSAVSLVLTDWPYPARLFITLIIEVFILTYVVMPPLTKVLVGWIYPKPKEP